MFAIGFGFLALFSILSIVLTDTEPRRIDPRDDVKLWVSYVAR
jgi:hypothetical protein